MKFKYVCNIFITGKTDCALNGMCDSYNGLHDENSEFSYRKTLGNST